jgi:hypothetical protein
MKKRICWLSAGTFLAVIFLAGLVMVKAASVLNPRFIIDTAGPAPRFDAPLANDLYHNIGLGIFRKCRR